MRSRLCRISIAVIILFDPFECQTKYMIIIIHGKDTYRSLRKLGEVRSAFCAKTNGEAICIDGETITKEALNHRLKTDGLFSRDKLIIIKDMIAEGGISKMNDLVPLMLKEKKHAHIVIFERDAIDMKQESAQALQAEASVNGKMYYPEFTPPTIAEVRERIKKAMQKAGKTIERDALEEVASAVTDSFALHGAINILTHLETNHITCDTLDWFSLGGISQSIFQLTDALAARQKQKALSILNRLLTRGSDPIYILSMLHRHLRIITKISSYIAGAPYARESEIARAIQEHAFAVKKALPSARGLSFPALISIYDHLLAADRQLKKSALPKETLLAQLVYRMSM